MGVEFHSAQNCQTYLMFRLYLSIEIVGNSNCNIEIGIWIKGIRSRGFYLSSILGPHIIHAVNAPVNDA